MGHIDDNWIYLHNQDIMIVARLRQWRQQLFFFFFSLLQSNDLIEHILRLPSPQIPPRISILSPLLVKSGYGPGYSTSDKLLFTEALIKLTKKKKNNNKTYNV